MVAKVQEKPLLARRPWRRSTRGVRRPTVSMLILSTVIVAGTVGPFIAPHNPTRANLSRALQPPVFAGGDWAHVLGTDELGRDLLSRLIGGARVSVLVGLAVIVVSGLVGLVIGLVSGYLGGRTDSILMRITDATLAFPFLLLALVLVGIFGASTQNVIIILAVSGWANYARVIRSEVTSLRTQEFVSISRVMGGGPLWIMWRHLIPNVTSSLLVLATLQLGLAIVAEGSLSFLGMGVPPPAPSWGRMLSDGRNLLVAAWWAPVLPGVALSLTVLSSNLIGDWLRTRHDPTSRR